MRTLPYSDSGLATVLAKRPLHVGELLLHPVAMETAGPVYSSYAIYLVVLQVLSCMRHVLCA